MKRLDQSQNWLELAKQARWSVDGMAKLCCVSVRKLERDFHKNMGQSPKIWLLEQRQREAYKLLQNRCTPIKEVASQLGYKYAHHFSREFKKYWGICPTEFSPNALENRNCRVLVSDGVFW